MGEYVRGVQYQDGVLRIAELAVSARRICLTPAIRAGSSADSAVSNTSSGC
jgi:hypothetical protein